MNINIIRGVVLQILGCTKGNVRPNFWLNKKECNNHLNVRKYFFDLKHKHIYN